MQAPTLLHLDNNTKCQVVVWAGRRQYLAASRAVDHLRHRLRVMRFLDEDSGSLDEDCVSEDRHQGLFMLSHALQDHCQAANSLAARVAGGVG